MKAEWLGHDDPGFTLRVDAHMMPDSAATMRTAIDKAFGDPASATNVRRLGG